MTSRRLRRPPRGRWRPAAEAAPSSCHDGPGRPTGERDMRELVMWNLMTLDGFFEGTEPWSIDFHDEVWGEELERFSIEQAQSIGALLFGRRTYEGMAKYWQSAAGETADFMNAVPKVVFSRTLASADWANSRLVRKGAAAEVA